MATFSLDDIRAAADAKYGSLDIPFGDDQTCRLLNPLRMPKADRDALIAKQEELGDEKADQEALLAECIMLIGEHKPTTEALLKTINGDLAVLMTIFEAYNEGSQVGEASPSQD